MTAMFSKPKAPPVLPAPTSADAQAAAQAQRMAAASAMGRQQTILTSGLGDTSTPITAQKQLLGA